MPTRTFTRAQLDTMGLPNDIVTADYAADHPEWVTAHPGVAIELHREQTESRRWESVNTLVFRAPDDGRTWQVDYLAPLTEMQDSDPWDYASEVEAVEVEQELTVVMEWRPVADTPPAEHQPTATLGLTAAEAAENAARNAASLPSAAQAADSMHRALARPAGLDALLDHVAANLPDENDDQPTGQRFPCGLGVFCDTCGAEWRGDFVVTDTMTNAERLAVVRDHVRAELGWQCDDTGDFCPKCQPDAPADSFTEAAIRHSALIAGALAIEALPQDYECDPGRGDAARLIRRLAAVYTTEEQPTGPTWEARAEHAVGLYARTAIERDDARTEAAKLRAERDELIQQRDRIADDTIKARVEQPTDGTERPAAEIIREQHDNITFNRGDIVAAVRDALLDPAVHTPATATTAARVLLAAHTRDLAEQARTLARERGAEMRERGDRSRVATCAGMHAVRRHLADHAARLDGDAEDGR
ncbi:hypothetical protein [Streptomyces sp. NPDC001750]|uniref:hypothetical protein n=1 Tax=unclassified Streptomyces TaxID=2593676 RepID=UPI0036929D4A